MWYMVFGSRRRPVWGGSSYLDWEGIIGVYKADDPDEACKAAARDNETFGTYFAMEGHPWGVELNKPNAEKLGDRKSPSEELMEKLVQRDADLTAAITKLLPSGDSDAKRNT